MCWEFEISGYREDIDLICDTYNKDPKIERVEAFGPALIIEDYSDDEEIKDRAKSIMKRIRTAHMSELHPEYPPVLSGKSSPPEGGTHLPFQEAPRSGSRGESVDYELGIDKETYQNLFVDLPEHDRKSAELISVLDMRYDWVDLYWVYEWIQEEVGNPHDRGWIPKDKEDLFTRTAQSREVLGTDARHGDLNPDRAPEDPMEWEDAIELVHTIVAKYLERRLERVNWSPDD